MNALNNRRKMNLSQIYNLNNDPKRLLKLLDEGNEIICLVDYTMNFGERRIVQSDICIARKDIYDVIRFTARGICYIQFGGEYEQRTFEGMCEEENVRYIDPFI